MRHAESLPHMLEQAEINRFHAMMLLERAGSGDLESARTLLSEALDTYSRIEMCRHIELAQALLDKSTRFRSGRKARSGNLSPKIP
jgi:hypothetical protein